MNKPSILHQSLFNLAFLELSHKLQAAGQKLCSSRGQL